VAKKAEIVVLCIVSLCSVVVGYQHREPCCLQIQGWSAWWTESGCR